MGTRGVPAQYGGFETAVEEVGARLVAMGHEVTVYCRNPGQRHRTHRGMRLVNLPAVRAKTAETLTHTALSVMHLCARPADVVVLFNAANAPFLPVLRARGIPVAVHVDGLEWQRGKWGWFGRRYYLACERLAVRMADRLIADAQAIGSYYEQRYGRTASFLPYGAPIQVDAPQGRLAGLGLTANGYHLVVARMEPENHVDMIVAGYARSRATLPLVVVGDAPYGGRHVEAVQEAAGHDKRIRLLGRISDQELLDQLYANAATYVHGHSVGGTNPSLLRAMGAATPVLAFDVAFNHEVLGQVGEFFADEDALRGLLEAAEADMDQGVARGLAGQERARTRYDWDAVVSGYERLCCSLLMA